MTNIEIYRNLEITLINIEKRTDGTLNEYNRSVRQIEKYFNKKSLNDLTIEELKDYVKYLKSKNYKPTTYNTKMAAYRYVFGKLLNKKNIDEIFVLVRIRPLKTNQQQ